MQQNKNNKIILTAENSQVAGLATSLVLNTKNLS